jgi:hypothetical protein
MLNNIYKNNNLKLIGILIILNLFTGRYFENLRIINIPINQIILLYLIINLFIFKNLLIISKNTIIKYINIYLIYSFIQLLFSFIENGIWALRDGLYVINLLFFLCGYTYANKHFDSKKLYLLFKIIYFIAIVYLFLKVFSVESFGLAINSAQGNKFFLINYFNLKHIFMWVGFYLLIIYKDKNFLIYMMSIIFITISIILFQSRSTYISLFVIIIFMLKFNKLKMTNIFYGVFLIFFMSIMFDLFDIKIKGRFQEVSLNFFINHFKTLFIFSQEYKVNNIEFVGQESSAQMRYDWWLQVINKNLSSLKLTLFGQGFGIPLMDFQTSQLGFAREPHNMFVTIFGRQGLFGLSLFLIIFFKSFKNFFYKIKLKIYKNNDREVLIVIFLYILIVSVGFIGDSILNYSSASIPSYFFWGIIIGYRSEINNVIS